MVDCFCRAVAIFQQHNNRLSARKTYRASSQGPVTWAKYSLLIGTDETELADGTVLYTNNPSHREQLSTLASEWETK